MASDPVDVVGDLQQHLLPDPPSRHLSELGAVLPVHGFQDFPLQTLPLHYGYAAPLDGGAAAWPANPALQQLQLTQPSPIQIPASTLPGPVAFDVAAAGLLSAQASQPLYDLSSWCQFRVPEHSPKLSETAASARAFLEFQSETTRSDQGFNGHAQVGYAVQATAAASEHVHAKVAADFCTAVPNPRDKNHRISSSSHRNDSMELHNSSLSSVGSEYLYGDSCSASSSEDLEQVLAATQHLPDVRLACAESFGSPRVSEAGKFSESKLTKLAPDPKKIAASSKDGELPQVSEEERRRMRIVRNRESAERSRMKKRNAQAGLETRVKRLSGENLALRNALEALQPGLSTLVLSNVSKLPTSSLKNRLRQNGTPTSPCFQAVCRACHDYDCSICRPGPC
jgi:hypothetical protein